MASKAPHFVMKNGRAEQPKVIQENLELYYDVKGKTNNDAHKDTLLDMSGNKKHGTLTNFAYGNQSGYADGLIFDRVDDTLTRPAITGLDPNNMTYQLNGNILRFDGDEVKTVKDVEIETIGRNLFQLNKLNNLVSIVKSGNGFKVMDSYATSTGIPFNSIFKVGETYTISYDLVRPDDITNATVGRVTNLTQHVVSVVQIGESRVEETVTITDNSGTLFVYGFSTGVVEFNNFKIEKGSTSTPYIPSPEHLIAQTALKRNILGDLEGVIDSGDRDRVSGEQPLFTDKADDDSVVHVDMDGKSYQHAGSGKNVFPYLINRQAVSVSGKAEVLEGKITLNEIGDRVTVRFPWDGRDSKIRIKADFSENGLINSRYYDSEGLLIGANGVTFAKGFGRIGVIPYALEQGDLRSARYIELIFTTDSNLAIPPYTIDNIMVTSANDDLTNYEPPAPSPDYPIEIHSLNEFYVVSSVGKRNLYTDRKDIDHVLDMNTYTIASHLPVGEYTISFDYDVIEENMRIRNFLLYSSTAYEFSNVPIKTDSNSRVFRTFTVTDDMSVGHIWLYAGRGSTESRANHVVFKDVKIEKGSTATPYSPAPEDITENDNPPLIDKINLSLSEPLRSVGDVKDRLFRDSNGLWKVERNVGEYTFTGNESLSVEQRFDSIQMVQANTGAVPNKKVSADMNGASNRFEIVYGVTSGGDDQTGIRIHSGYNVTRFKFKPREFLGVDYSSANSVIVTALKNWLSNNQTTILYTLATSTIETLDQELQDKLNNIASFSSSNYVYTVTDNDVYSELYAAFKSKDYLKEDRTVNNLLIYNRALSDDEMLHNYELFHERFNMRSDTYEDNPTVTQLNLTSGGTYAHSIEQNITLNI